MEAENTELNTALFMEEVQKYPAIYNTFCKDYKNTFVRMSIWKAIGDKFALDAAEAEKKYKNLQTAYGRYLRKKGLFHLVLDLMLSPLQQGSVIWIGWQTTSTNDHPLLQTCRVAFKAKMMQIMVRKQKAQTIVEDSLEYEERSSEDESLLQSERSVSPATDSPSNSSAANGGQPKRSSFCL